MEHHILLATDYCITTLTDLKTVKIDEEYGYASLPLCVVDSVFSIGVRYEGVKNTINNVCAHYNIEKQASQKGAIPKIEKQLSVSGFLKLLEQTSDVDFLASQVFKNRQRTSVKNGILKAEAVVKFLNVLNDFGVDYFQDVSRLMNNNSFEFCVKSIPGQKSGISLKYFFMLAGNEDYIKPDRMIIRFLEVATGYKFNLEECQVVLTGVTNELNKQGYQITPRLLDNIIWNYQRLN